MDSYPQGFLLLIQVFEESALTWLLSGALILLVLTSLALVFRYRAQVLRLKQSLHQSEQRFAGQQRQISHLVYNDNLTGLPNRQNMMERVDHAIELARRHKRQLALLLLDLDRFKSINETLGHAVGDELLKTLSSKLKLRLREADTLARLGGDEFLVLLEDLNGHQDAQKVAQDLLAIVREPVDVIGHVLRLSTSIGIAMFPEHGQHSQDLIRHADSAMYSAKENGKDGISFYDHQLQQKSSRRMQLEHALREGLDNDEFEVVYQPQIDLLSNRVHGVEALLRWNSPRLGTVSPVEFIPVAEDNGFIIELGRWVFERACRDFHGLEQAGYQLNSLAINVSSIQFRNVNLCDEFSAAASQYGIAPDKIEIEVTERYIMEDTSQNRQVIESLRDQGFRISVDDFGTGYSSMSYLKLLPLDLIKIDKSFIDDIPSDHNDVQITLAILALSSSLGYAVIAEGIETSKQKDFLTINGCKYGQGYFFSRPLALPALQQFLTEHK